MLKENRAALLVTQSHLALVAALAHVEPGRNIIQREAPGVYYTREPAYAPTPSRNVAKLEAK